MPSIADQVATLEHDLADALALIDQLNAANSALTSANTSLQRDNVALQLEVNDMKHYVDDTRAMAEQIAGSAYEMLRASRRQVGTPAEVIPFAPKPKGLTGLRDSDTIASGEASLDAKIVSLPEQWPAQNAVHDIMTGDSGDEHRDTLEYCHGPGDCTLACTCVACHDAKMPDISLAEAQRATPLPPHAGPMLVTHEGGLPIFLQRDAPYNRTVFG